MHNIHKGSRIKLLKKIYSGSNICSKSPLKKWGGMRQTGTESPQFAVRVLMNARKYGNIIAGALTLISAFCSVSLIFSPNSKSPKPASFISQKSGTTICTVIHIRKEFEPTSLGNNLASTVKSIFCSPSPCL